MKGQTMPPKVKFQKEEIVAAAEKSLDKRSGTQYTKQVTAQDRKRQRDA